MNKVVPIVLSSLAFLILVGLIIGYVILSSKQGKLAESVTKSQTLLLASGDQYAKCYNSVNYGSSMVMDVSLTYLKWNSSEAEKTRLDQIETDFMTEVEEKCNSKVSAYENEYKAYEAKVAEYEKSGWINFLVGGSVVGTNAEDLSPSRVRMNAGFPLSTLIFTKEEVNQYFAERV